MLAEHRFAVRVYYEDTDAGGVVYHARYLHFAERARTEWLRALGFDHPGLLAEHGVVFVVAGLRASFKRPARLDELLTVITRPERLGGAALELQQTVLCNEMVTAELAVRLGLLGADGRPRRVPTALRALFEASER